VVLTIDVYINNINVNLLTCFDVVDELLLVKRRKERKPSKVRTSLLHTICIKSI
jgi:hypothetical protein